MEERLLMFTEKQIQEINELLSDCTDEELFEIFGADVFEKVKEVIAKRMKRPKAVYTNTTPYRNCKRVTREEKFIHKLKTIQMKIYVASSWKNQHGVEMLTALLRENGHEVTSWVENSYDEQLYIGYDNMRKWLNSENGSKAFEFDTEGALNCDLMIFYTYAGNDAHAELALAWSKGIPVIGLYSKGYEEGLMSKMVTVWCVRYTEVLQVVEEYSSTLTQKIA
jgi:hypothetical protein